MAAFLLLGASEFVNWIHVVLFGVFLAILLALGLALCAWIVWYATRELSAILLPRKRAGRRRNLQFGFPMIFGIVTATAITCSFYAARDREVAFGFVEFVGLVLGWALLLCFFYLAVYAMGNLFVSFGWMKAPGDMQRLLRGHRLPDPGRGLTQEDVERIEVPAPESPEANDREPSRKKKRRKRHWWARAMPNRSQFVNPGKDHNVPLDRDEWAG